MKKLLVILLGAVFVLSLTACGRNKPLAIIKEVETTSTTAFDFNVPYTEPAVTVTEQTENNRSELIKIETADFSVELPVEWKHEIIYDTFMAIRGNNEAMLMIVTVGMVETDGVSIKDIISESGLYGANAQIITIDTVIINNRDVTRTEMVMEIMEQAVETVIYTLTDDTGLYMLMYYKTGEIDYTSEFEEIVESFLPFGIKGYSQ